MNESGHSITAIGPSQPAIMSFLIGTRAYDYVADHADHLLPPARVAVAQAGRRGAIAGSFYFVDAPDAVAVEVRNSLRRGALDGGRDARACDAGAAAIDNRRRVAWYARACPRCGGSIRPRSWLTPGVYALICRDCRWTVPD